MKRSRKGLGQLKSLMKFLGNPKELDGPESFYLKLYLYLHNAYQMESMAIWALPQDYKSGRNLMRPRLVWFQGAKRPVYKAIPFHQKLERWEKNKGLLKSQKYMNLFFSLGVFAGHRFYLDARVPAKSSVFLELWDYTREYLENMFLLSNRLAELMKVKNLVHIDDISGLYNQRKLSLDLRELIQSHTQTHGQFSVLFIDIDHFKHINDNYGHVIGTKILAELAKTMRARLRDNDLVYRYGGDEFVMLLPNVDAELAKKIAMRILGDIRGQPIVVDGGLKFPISVSIGVAVFPRDAETPEEILTMADKMMYEAKRGGRGRVCYAGEVLSTLRSEATVRTRV
ncbi:MAG: GGDEF domain-containing protein [Bdellovibrio sp.]|nr:GGDEF domain-containing protein [Bdellovibrio sp.]